MNKQVLLILAAAAIGILTIANSLMLYQQQANAANLSATSTPQFINYQGRLTDGAGNPITGERQMIFRLYGQATAGTALWSESVSVSVNNGVFDVLLGIPATFFDGSNRYLGVTVGNDTEITPRRQVVSVPYAYWAEEAASADDADTVDGMHANDFAATSHSHSALDAADGDPVGVLSVDGEGNVDLNGPLNMQAHQISNMASPSDSSDAATKGYVDGAEKKKYTVVLGLQSPTYCPQGYTLENTSDLSGPDGWLYIYILPSGLFMGGLNTPNSAHEHLYAKISTSDAAYICWKTFDSTTQPYTAVFLTHVSNYSCPTGYSYIPRTEAVRADGWGYLEMNEGGLYLGGLNNWARVSQAYENGWQARRWTTHINSICFKVMGVEGEGNERATGVFPVTLGVRDASACPAGYTHDSVENLASSNGYVYLILNDNSAAIGGRENWWYGGENYNQIHIQDTRVNVLCWKFYEAIGTPHLSIKTLKAGTCPTDYISIDANQLKGSNDTGYIQKTAYGLYMGGLNGWARQAYLDGSIYHTFTSQVSHRVCLKLENVIDD